MNQKRNRKLIHRHLWLLCLPLLLFLLALRQRRVGPVQNRLYVINNLSEPIVKMRIYFSGYGGAYGGKDHVLIFRDVPSHGKQWQLFGPKWGNGDSGRWIEVDAVTVSGRRFKKDSEFATTRDRDEDPINDLKLGARFYVTAEPDGTLEVLPNH